MEMDKAKQKRGTRLVSQERPSRDFVVHPLPFLPRWKVGLNSSTMETLGEARFLHLDHLNLAATYEKAGKLGEAVLLDI